MDETPKKKRSEKRQRKKTFSVRLSDAEKVEYTKRCSEAGLNESDYFKLACLEAKPLRKFRQKTVERELLIKIEVALNRIGSNINQLVAKANSAGFLSKEEKEKIQNYIAEAHKVIEALLPQS